jgi:hypothetical protein
MTTHLKGDLWLAYDEDALERHEIGSLFLPSNVVFQMRPRRGSHFVPIFTSEKLLDDYLAARSRTSKHLRVDNVLLLKVILGEISFSCFALDPVDDSPTPLGRKDLFVSVTSRT